MCPQADQRNAGPDWRTFGVVDREVLGCGGSLRRTRRRSGICARPVCRSSASRSIWGDRTARFGSSSPTTGARRPSARERCPLRLSLAEREEISRGLAAGLSIRAIARGLNRSPSTVCREVNANGGPLKYRALPADRGAQRRALRPKRAKLAQCRRLRSVVERKLEARWSPQQISGWLAEQYPNDPEMRVSHETIYQSLFVQSRGALRKELHACLRTGRAMRRAKAYTKGGVGQGQLRDMVMISERPAEVADRAVPGHWEGDLIFGKKMTSIGTLVERHSRYVILLKLPNGHGAPAVRACDDQTDLDPARAAAPVDHLGPRQRDGRTRPVHRSTPVCRSTSAIRRVPGSAAATRTPTDCSANTSRSRQTSRSAPNASSTPSPARSTHDLDRPSAG